MRYVYAGGMTVSHQILRLLCEAGEQPLHAFGYPPNLAHRSNYQPLNDLAEKFGFPLTTIQNINDPGVLDILTQARPDWFFVFGWSQLVSEELLRVPRYGTLGFHMTRLPEGRGRAPVAWTLIKGKTEGGVSLLWLEPGADNGPIAAQRTYPVSVFDDAETVVERVNRIAGDIIQEVLPALRSGTLPRYPQDESRASYWAKRTPDDGLINWDLPARDLYNFIRGVTHPFPGAFSYIEGRKVLILKTGVVACALREKAGTVLGPYCSHGKEHQAGIAVAAQGGLLIILRLATEDGAAVDGARLVAFAEKWQGKQFQAFR